MVQSVCEGDMKSFQRVGCSFNYMEGIQINQRTEFPLEHYNHRDKHLP